jgi:hypothetical protein
MSKTQTYVALNDGRVAGKRVTAGDKIELTAAQAKYERVRLVNEDQTAEPADATRPAAKAKRGAAED